MFHPSIIDAETYTTLKVIFQQEEIYKNFALAGGTSLALQLQHRHSIDLDIFSPSPIETKNIELFLSAQHNLSFRLVNSNKNMLFAYINNIKCDFVFEPATPLFPFIENDGINYFDVRDIAAMKMHTICGRGKKKDFFDLFVLAEALGWKNMLRWFEQKYDRSQFYFLWRSISYFADADEDPDINGIPPYSKNWEEVKAYIKSNCI